MTLHETRGWGFGPMPVAPSKPKGDPMHIIRAREFDRRKSQVLLLLNSGPMTQIAIREAMDWPSGSTWRVLTRLLDLGQIDRVHGEAAYELRRIGQ